MLQETFGSFFADVLKKGLVLWGLRQANLGSEAESGDLRQREYLICSRFSSPDIIYRGLFAFAAFGIFNLRFIFISLSKALPCRVPAGRFAAFLRCLCCA
jgi:hypothetical protein